MEYNASEFGEAFLDYQAAYEIDALPELTFDMAQCQRGLHHWDRAQALYRRYLLERPQAGNRAKVEEVLRQMDDRRQIDLAAAAAEQQGDAELPQSAHAPPRPGFGGLPSGPGTKVEADAVPLPALVATRRKRIPKGVWVASGLGAACLFGAGGLGIAVLAQPDHAAGLPPLHSLGYSQLQAINTEGTVAVGLAIGGAILLGTGLLFGLAAR